MALAVNLGHFSGVLAMVAAVILAVRSHAITRRMLALFVLIHNKISTFRSVDVYPPGPMATPAGIHWMLSFAIAQPPGRGDSPADAKAAPAGNVSG